MVTYTTKDGAKLIAKSGEVVYTPTNSEYTATIIKLNDNGYTIGVNFALFDENLQPTTLENGIEIHSNIDKNVELLLRKLCQNDAQTPYLKKRILLLQLLLALSSHSYPNSYHPIIAPALSYLAQNPEKATPILELAKACSVSEGYFRKKFRECMGVSPIEYRNTLRLEQAKAYLERDEKNILEISERLGYATVSHFCQQFKKQYGISPLSYRNDYNLINRQL
jgi:AraC-like DNA-binding protein